MDAEFERLLDGCASGAERGRLAEQLKGIDVAYVRRAFAKATAPEAAATSNSVEPLDDEAFGDTEKDPATTSRWRQTGLEAVAAGRVGVLLMAGGQGTRLGSTLPKGMYDIGLPSRRSLYQLQAERIRKLERLATGGAGEALIPWYIMTSENTHSETQRFLEDHSHFGLDPSQVVLFRQGELPCLTPEGELMRSTSRDALAMAPDGNGGLFRAAHDAGVIADMRRRGVVYVHVYGVDNCLVRVGDPVFVGFCADRGVDAAAKVVTKAHPHEAVGVFARRGGAVQVVEYSEIDEATATAVRPDGTLRFNAANIANHLFTVDFIERAVRRLDELTYHVARKKIPTLDASGAVVKRDGIKLELFVFDAFVFAERVGLLQVARADEFSPLKNAPGAKDGAPEHARADLCDLHRRFLLHAGATLVGEGACELAPAVTYAGEGLKGLAGREICLPLCADEPAHLGL